MSNKDITVIRPQKDIKSASYSYYQGIDFLVAPRINQFAAVHYPIIDTVGCWNAVITTAFLSAYHDNAWITPSFTMLDISKELQKITNDPEQATNKFRKHCPMLSIYLGLLLQMKCL
jgi:hypothetical protein